MSIITYYCVLYVGPGSPLDFSMLVVPDYDESNAVVGVLRPPEMLVANSVMVKGNGGFRFCSKCKSWKPDRSHHCSSCDKCILRMDHHCPWFGICIGFKNHRFFVQFLIWSEIYLIIVTWISGWILVQFFVRERWSLQLFSLHILFTFSLGILLMLCVFVFLGFTIYQVLKNKTTIESYEMQRYRRQRRGDTMGNVFDLGWERNWKVMMGDHFYQWLLPVTYYPKSRGFEDRLLVQQGLCFPLSDHAHSGRLLVERLSGELERGLN